MNINEQLISLYNANLEGIKEISKQDFTEGGVDGPLLMYCWEEEYSKANFKILFIGQETNNWIGGFPTDEIDIALSKYKDFRLGKKPTDECNTLFWAAVREINCFLNSSHNTSLDFLWTNISKYCTSDGKEISKKENDFILERLNILEDEIKIIKPNIVIFLSGPDYDDWLARQLTKSENIKPEFEEIYQDISKHELAVVIHPSLPCHSYRTYHPIHLNYSNKWHYLSLITSKIT